jgi:hypothetical protein
MGVALNLGDRSDVTAAVDALPIPPEGVVADVGFGGGVGIVLLLDRIDARGKVHGVESLRRCSAARLIGFAMRYPQAGSSFIEHR